MRAWRIVPTQPVVLAVVSLGLPVWLPIGVMLADTVGLPLAWPDGRFWSLFRHSLAVAGGTTALALVLGLPPAWLLGRTRLPAARLLCGLLVVPLLVPPYISAIGWLHLLGRTGALNASLAVLLGLRGPPIDLYTRWGAIWIMGLSTFPIVTLLSLAALDSLNPDLEEAALLEGGPWSVLRRVTLPLILPAVHASAILVFLVALGEFAVPSFLGVQVYAVDVFNRFAAFYDFRAGAAAALPLLGLALIAFVTQRLVPDRQSSEASYAARRRMDLRAWRWPALALLLLPLWVATLSPLCALARRAPMLQDYVFAWQIAWPEIANSLRFAVLAATLSVLAGLPVAWCAVRGREWWVRQAAEACGLLPVAVPGTVLGIGLIRVWNRGAPFAWVYGSLGIIVLGDIARALPFVVAALILAWRHLPAALEEAAYTAGASWGQAMRWVIVPLLRPGLIVAWCLAFVVAMTELPTTLLVYPPGHATLPVRIFTLQHDGQAEHVAALCLILLAVTVVPVCGLWAWSSRYEGGS